MSRLRYLAFATALVVSGRANAGDIRVLVRDGGGKPVANAVVWVEVPGTTAAKPGHYRINQRDIAFDPGVMVIPIGSTVDFANLDPVRHHVYSFSPAKKFELKLFGKGESRSVRFDRPGVVAVGCNIHDSMQAFIHIVATPFAARTGRDGRAVIRSVPGGPRSLTIWHALQRAPASRVTRPVNASANLALTVPIRLRRPAPMSHDY